MVNETQNEVSAIRIHARARRTAKTLLGEEKVCHKDRWVLRANAIGRLNYFEGETPIAASIASRIPPSTSWVS